MKKTFLILAALLAGVSLRAGETKSDYSVTLDFPYTTKYVFRGVELAKGSFQPSIEATSGPFKLGLWTNQPVTDNSDNEIDFYAGYSTALPGGWNLDAGGTMYYYPELNHSTGANDTTFEPYVGLTRSINGFSPGVYVYYDLTRETLTTEGQLGYSIPLEAVGASLDFSANLGRVDPKSGGDYTYYSLGASVPFKLSAHGTFTVGVNYAHNNISGIDNDHLYGTAGVTIGY
jgi:uncharacterized protein (TIGR02001 family)